MQIRPFSGYRVNCTVTQQVVAPAYDSLSPQERHQFAVAHPQNFVNTMRTPDEFPAAERPSYEALLVQNYQHLKQLLNNHSFVKLDRSSMFLYRLAIDNHQQTGLICEVPIAEYESGIVRKHENTRRDKENMLVRYLEVVPAVSSPICLAYEQNPIIDQLVEQQMTTKPLLDFISPDGVSQTVWWIDETCQSQLIKLFADIPIAYLTDGHHRAASASRFAAKKKEKTPDLTADDPALQLLVALFPHNQLRIMSYNRCVRDLNGLDHNQFLSNLQQNFEVTFIGKWDKDTISPDTPGQFGMFLDGQWYLLVVKPHALQQVGFAQALDVSLLQDYILEPLLGITDVRDNPRLEYVAGVSGVSGLEKQCHAGWRLAFACHPTSIEEVMRVSDNFELMPPKSTWFDPKVRSGIFVSWR